MAKTPHHIAVRDFMHAPVIAALELDSYTGRPGDVIRILGADDFKIVRVEVSILTVDRQVLEEGEAEWDGMAGCWVYIARTLVPSEMTVLIEAAAMDLPGNRGTAKAYYYVEPSPQQPTTDNQ